MRTFPGKPMVVNSRSLAGYFLPITRIFSLKATRRTSRERTEERHDVDHWGSDVKLTNHLLQGQHRLLSIGGVGGGLNWESVLFGFQLALDSTFLVVLDIESSILPDLIKGTTERGLLPYQADMDRMMGTCPP